MRIVIRHRLALSMCALALAYLAMGSAGTSQANGRGRNGPIVFEVLNDQPVTGVVRDFDVFIASSGSRLRRLTSGPQSDTFPRWSPDGERIAFVRGEQDTLNPDIYVMNADGSSPVNLTNSATAYDIFPSWSPDGQRIVYASAPNNLSTRIPRDVRPDHDLFVMNADGAEAVSLFDEAGTQWMPDWSPTGDWIAYEDVGKGIGLIRPDGSDQHLLVDARWFNERRLLSPAWSPDGQTLLFTVGYAPEDSPGDIWLIRKDGRGLTQLTRSEADDFFANWSPDGKKIVFSSTRGGDYGLYTMDPDGSHVERLIDIDLRTPASPDWGPRP